jgi:hypothetical protein
MVRNRLPTDARALTAYRAIRETEVFLAEHLRRPHLTPRIPVVRVGYGRFPPGLASEFWGAVLELNGA